MNTDERLRHPAFRFYRRLIALYPGPFRSRYGAEMEHDFIASSMRLRRSDSAARRHFILVQLLDVIRTLPKEWWSASSGIEKANIVSNLTVGPLLVFAQPGTLTAIGIMILWFMIASATARALGGRKFGVQLFPFLLITGGLAVGYGAAHWISWPHEYRDRFPESFQNFLYFVSAVGLLGSLSPASRTKRGLDFGTLVLILSFGLSFPLAAAAGGVPIRLLCYGGLVLAVFKSLALNLRTIGARSDQSGPPAPAT